MMYAITFTFQTEDDPDRGFLLSLLPGMKELPEEKRSLLRIKFQQLLHETRFEARAPVVPAPQVPTPAPQAPQGGYYTQYSGASNVPEHSSLFDRTYTNL